MNRTRVLSVLLLLGSYGAGQSMAGGAAEIEQLQVHRDGADVKIEVILTSAVKPSVETAINPDRLVLTLPGTVSEAKQKRFPLNANGVRGVRVGLNSANPPVTRVVVDLDSAHAYTVSSEGKSIILRVQGVQEAQTVRHDGPAPAASAPLVDVFRHKPQAAPVPDSSSTAQAPIPAPPKLPPLNFPENQPANNQVVTTASDAKPSAAHPKLGSLQQGTVLPSMGTPGTGAVPPPRDSPTELRAESSSAGTTVAATSPAQGGNAAASQGASALTTSTANQTAAVIGSAATSTPNPASSMQVSIANAGRSAPLSVTVTPGSPAPGALPTTSASTAAAAAPNVNPATPSASPSPNASSITSSAGAPNVTTKVLSATVAAEPAAVPPSGTTAAPQGATVANPLGLSPGTTLSTSGAAATGANQSAPTAPAPQVATVANPLGSAPPPASNGSSQASSATSNGTSASQPSTFQGATVSNPLGLPPGTTAPLATSAEAVEDAASTSQGIVPGGPSGSEVVPTISSDLSPTDGKVVVQKDETVASAKATDPALSVDFALRATHPDFRTAFRVKYVASGAAYLDGGRAAGLTEGMKLVVRDKPTGSVTGAASGNPDDIVAELDVLSVAESSAVTDIHTPKRDVKPGDLAYLSAQDEQSLVQKSTLSSTRKYPTVVSFTDEDTLDDEARAEIPKPPMPSVNRARGRFGFSYMGMNSPGANSSSSRTVGLVARMDMTRIGGTYWNLNGYWTGRLTQNSSTGVQTLQDLINRTYHLAMTYDNPHSAWVAGFGRLFLPWATSLETIDGGYFGRRLGHGTTLGMFAGSTPDPTSYSYSPNRRIAGTFVNFEGGDFNAFHYTSTSGFGISTLQWKIDRPFIFFENGLSWKRYVSIYDALQADSPAANQAVTAPGPGIGRNFLTVRVMPISRLEFDANYNYFRDLPTFDPTLIGTGLLDKYLFQGFSAGVRLEALKQVWLYTQLGESNRSGDAHSSLNELYGITFGRVPWIHIGADAHYSRFNSSFGSGFYESVSINRRLSDAFQLEVLAGEQNFSSQYSSNNLARFLTSTLEMNLGMHYFFQGGYTASRGTTLDYNQWLFTFGYRFDTRQRIKDQ